MNNIKHGAILLNEVMNDKHYTNLKTKIVRLVCVDMLAAVDHHVIYVYTLL
jgi:hypothetical protein